MPTGRREERIQAEVVGDLDCVLRGTIRTGANRGRYTSYDLLLPGVTPAGPRMAVCLHRNPQESRRNTNKPKPTVLRGILRHCLASASDHGSGVKGS